MRSAGVATGSQALEKLRSAASAGDPYDLAVLNTEVAGADGIELARKIKIDPAAETTRLVLLATVGQRGHGQQARDAGVEAYLTEPVSRSELRGALLAVLSMPAGASPEHAPRLITRHSLREEKAGARPRLLVADDAASGAAAAGVLEELGYQADLANTGAKALEKLSGSTYGAVLLSIDSSTGNGYEIVTGIRKESGGSPLIAVTADPSGDTRQRILAAGVDDCLSKPLDSGEAGAVLSHWLPAPQSPLTPEPEEPEPVVHGSGVSDNPGVSGEEADLPLLDEAVLENLRRLQEEGEPDILADFVRLFLEDAPLLLETARRRRRRRVTQAPWSTSGIPSRVAATPWACCGWPGSASSSGKPVVRAARETLPGWSSSSSRSSRKPARRWSTR